LKQTVKIKNTDKDGQQKRELKNMADKEGKALV